jgi:hypothetical protein
MAGRGKAVFGGAGGATFALAVIAAVGVLAAPPARAQAAPPPLAIEGFALALSRYGPVAAEERTWLPGERVCARFLAVGIAPDGKGDLALAVGAALDRAAADVAPREVLRAPDAFAARRLPVAISFPIAGGAAPGPHTLAIVIEDRTTGARATRTAVIRVGVLRSLAALNPCFAADPDGEIERPAEFHVGETMRLVFGAAGLEPLGGKVRLEGDLEVRDEETAVTLSRRPRVLALEAPAEKNGPIAALDASILATATRPGTFLFRVILRDVNARKEAVIEREVIVRP